MRFFAGETDQVPCWFRDGRSLLTYRLRHHNPPKVKYPVRNSQFKLPFVDNNFKDIHGRLTLSPC